MLQFFRIPRQLITDDHFKRIPTTITLLVELDTGRGIGLIERVRQGQGKPTPDIRQAVHHQSGAAQGPRGAGTSARRKARVRKRRRDLS